MREAGRSSRPRLRPRPRPQSGTGESYGQQAAYVQIDTLQVGGHTAANSCTPARGDLRSPSVPVSICAYLSTDETVCAARPPALALGGTGQRPRPRVSPWLLSQRPSWSPPLVEPRWEPAVGARVRGSSGCETVSDGRECARRRVHEQCARHPTLRSPEPAPHTRTGPLQLPRAMILWKQKLKVGRNNGGPIGCNLGQPRTC